MDNIQKKQQTREELEKTLKILQEEAEKYYPGNIRELSQLTGIPEESIHTRIAYMIQTTSMKDKTLILDTILTFHRTKL